MSAQRNDIEWYEIVVEHPEAEELAAAIIPEDSGPAVTLRVDSVERVTISIWGSPNLPEDYCARARELGFSVLSCELKRGSSDWYAQCAELWQPLQLGDLHVRLVRNAEEVSTAPAPNEMIIVPGTGWGTGHHATTSLPLMLMQSPSLKVLSPKRILDLGCGSAILAIAAHKLFAGAQLDALDNDALALENARTNVALNAVHGIVLRHGSIEQAHGKYNLLLANIYAQVLLPLAERFRELAAPGAQLILSGLSTSSLGEQHGAGAISDINGAEEVLTRYQAVGWICLERRELDGWVAFRMSL